MNIIMVTNTFTPHVGGVARSVTAFTNEYRRLGHRVLVIAPQFEGTPEHEENVIRVPAIQNFNGSDFSMRLPVPALFTKALDEFQPEIVHSHHPFLLGGTALRLGASWDVPVVFTHHTMYEQYTHYVPGDSPALRRFAVELATGYANLCDQVVAPSQSIAAILKQRGVEAPVEVIPTGVDTARFAEGDGGRFRRAAGIPDDAFVVGHLGRLAEEKNLSFLSRAACLYLQENPGARFLVAGSGPYAEDIRKTFTREGLADRLHMAGVLEGQKLVDCYAAMDVFAFASLSETQGMVLTEAMAAGVPVVAVDANGVREVVVDRENGRLLPREDLRPFVEALDWVARLSPQEQDRLRRGALETAERFAMPRCAARALDTYRRLVGRARSDREHEHNLWETTLRRWETEWALWSNRARAAGAALKAAAHPAHSRPSFFRRLAKMWRPEKTR